MCGNFGLLLLSQSAGAGALSNSTHSKQAEANIPGQGDALDQSLNYSMHQVAQSNGIVLASTIEERKHEKQQKKQKTDELLPVIKILEAQTAATEIRGGQAGIPRCNMISAL